MKGAASMPASLKPTLEFLRELREHNDRQWFNDHRAQYSEARAAFEDFVADLIEAVGAFEDLAGVTPDECMFRIYRDTRFSPDKTPYKYSMSAIIGRGGRKPTGRGYYVHIQPDGESLVAGGLHSPSSAELDKVRQRIADDAAPLKRIVSQPDFVRYFAELRGESLKTAPQGYPKDHPDIDLLRRKQFLAEHALSDAQVLAPDAGTHIAQVCAAMQPFLTYLQML
jgi:uncharacterized protein (TIGR02453 family)